MNNIKVLCSTLPWLLSLWTDFSCLVYRTHSILMTSVSTTVLMYTGLYQYVDDSCKTHNSVSKIR